MPNAAALQPNEPIEKTVDRVLSVQRPLVLAHIRAIRASRPNASPEEIIRILERRYLAAVTTGGAAVGASAAIPGIGMVSSLALSGVETVGFLEASALFAQSVTEVHGIAIDDPERARALVMTLILGSAGTDLVQQVVGQATGAGPARNAYWGELVTKSLPKAVVSQLKDRLRKMFLKRFAARQGGAVLGRLIPFGIGAAIGGTGNHLLGRRVIQASRDAFGAAPAQFPASLGPVVPKEQKEPRSRIRGPIFKRDRGLNETTRKALMGIPPLHEGPAAPEPSAPEIGPAGDPSRLD